MLTGEKVILRPISFEDWEKTVKWRNDLEIKTSTMSHPFPITSEQEQEWYRGKLSSYDNRFLPFTIVSKENGEVLGFMNLNDIDWVNRNCFIGGAIGEQENFGKGYGKEAVKLLLDYAFGNLNLHKVYAYVLKNHPAIKTWYNLNAKLEGTLIEHSFQKGNYEDVCVVAWYPEKTEIR